MAIKISKLEVSWYVIASSLQPPASLTKMAHIAQSVRSVVVDVDVVDVVDVVEVGSAVVEGTISSLASHHHATAGPHSPERQLAGAVLTSLLICSNIARKRSGL